MQNLRKCAAIMIFLMAAMNHVYAQNVDAYPVVGKPCPEFVLKDVVNGNAKSISKADLKGKYFVLDFWSRWCTACIASFPKLKKLSERFDSKLNFILVGWDDRQIRPLFKKLNGKYDLQIPCAFDTVTFHKFGIKGLPHLIWVDSSGIVKAITNGEPLNVENLEKFINNKPLNLGVKPNAEQQVSRKLLYDKSKPFLIQGNGGVDSNFLYRSVLTKWNESAPNDIWTDHFRMVKGSNNEVFVSGITLSWLYRMAYGDTISIDPSEPKNNYGKLWYRPILELQDTSLFKFAFDSGKGLYCYNLKINDRPLSKLEFQRIMQRDLFNYFGYDVAVEKRKMPVWRLVKMPGYEKLRTKAKEPSYFGDGYTHIEFKNYHSSLLIKMLGGKFPSGPVFVDDTNLPWNIDLKINAVMTDINEISESLGRSSLSLIKDSMEMRVIVIRDRKY